MMDEKIENIIKEIIKNSPNEQAKRILGNSNEEIIRSITGEKFQDIIKNLTDKNLIALYDKNKNSIDEFLSKANAYNILEK